MSAPEETSERRRDPVIEWCATLGVFFLALFLRLYDLSKPHAFNFDETYYAKNAWSLLNFGYSRAYTDGADAHLLNGQTMDQWARTPELITHPEVGKWLIALGEWAFGMTPFGWRFVPALFGSLMVLIIIRLTRRLTGSLLLGLIAGLLMAFDGLHLVMSRLALIDIFLAFFSLLAVWLLVLDRDWLRARVTTPDDPHGWGARLWWRPWLLGAGLALGLAVGTKWSALYLMAALGLLFWAWAAGARRRVGIKHPWMRSALLDATPAFGYLVVVPFIVYVVSWTGWLMHAGTFEKAFSDTQYGPYWGSYIEKDATGVGEVKQSLRSLWHYHHDVYSFHTKFLNEETHPYQSKPAGWFLQSRPVAIDAQLDIPPGSQGCNAAAGSTCLRTIVALGNPVVWWVGGVALLWSLAMSVLRRDWRHRLVVVAVAATWLPWFQYDARPIFSYYAITIEPFMILSITLLLGQVIGSPRAGVARRRTGALAAGAFMAAVTAAFVFFWPIWTDQLMTNAEWAARMWFQRWI